MKNENDQPNRESKRPKGESDEHQPTEDAKSIKQLPVVFPLIMQGWTEPSSTLQPCALAIQPHVITDPIGASATRTISASTIQ